MKKLRLNFNSQFMPKLISSRLKRECKYKTIQYLSKEEVIIFRIFLNMTAKPKTIKTKS